MNKLALPILLHLCVSSFGAEVFLVTNTGVAFTHPSWRSWSQRDRVCVVRDDKELACGVVSKTSPKGAIAQMNFEKAKPVKGDLVRLASNRSPSFSPSLMESSSRPKPKKNGAFLIGAGLDAGLHYFYPTVQVQRTIRKKISLGATMHFFSGSSNDISLKTLGLLANASYYTKAAYQGFWIQGSVGLYAFRATKESTTETSLSPAVVATAGWRQALGSQFYLGGAAGLQWISYPNSELISVSYSAIQPIIKLTVDYRF